MENSSEEASMAIPPDWGTASHPFCGGGRCGDLAIGVEPEVTIDSDALTRLQARGDLNLGTVDLDTGAHRLAARINRDDWN
ncbi:hypothetical protein VDG09_20960 [Xanthomonas campestris pv. raphani]|uniref:hypothetical protein n=1 Tax=Xanthomonas campestris TaxID=339 RepID=UPI0023E9F9C3|nr:hypothetical protein [Xanthomonas campestris]MCW2039362.1 hypothetical protein [Xanthomonas campestris]MEA9830077.1 hypothetical protein [Xanthomonas campestris pv. raphani]